nr:MAG TPA: hypothetical protein [Caudoviricetes sp.]
MQKRKPPPSCEGRGFHLKISWIDRKAPEIKISGA